MNAIPPSTDLVPVRKASSQVTKRAVRTARTASTSKTVNVTVYRTKLAFKSAFRMLNDGKMQSLPFLVWAGLIAVTNLHRIWLPKDREAANLFYVYVLPTIFCIALFAIGLKFKKNNIWMATSAGGAFALAWCGCSFWYGLRIEVVMTGLILALICGVPYWIGYAKMVKPAAVIHQTPQIVEPPKPVDEFENFPWMVGAKWTGGRYSTKTGWKRELRIPRNSSQQSFCTTANIQKLANVLEISAKDLEVEAIPGKGHIVMVYAHDMVDNLAKPTLWPLTESKGKSIWEPIPIGIRKNGDIKSVTLRGKHFLFAGDSGSGKSNLQSLLVTAAVDDPRAEIYAFDGKHTELYHWRNTCVGYVQDNLEHAIVMLNHIVQRMYDRYDTMKDMKPICRDAASFPGIFPPVIVFIDELAGYIRDDGGDSGKVKTFRGLLEKLLEQGRAAGFVVVANTQRPSAALFGGGDLRAKFTYRIALRIDKRATNMALGTDGYDASIFDLETEKGMAFFIENGEPVVIRCYYLPDDILEGTIANLPVVPNDKRFGSFISSTDTSSITSISPEYDYEVIDGSGEISNSVSITSYGQPKKSSMERSIRKATSSDTFIAPSGKVYSGQWRIDVWNMTDSDEFKSCREYYSSVEVGRAPVNNFLQELTADGLLDTIVDESMTKWRRASNYRGVKCQTSISNVEIH